MSKEKYLKPEVIRQISSLDLKAKFIVEGFISGLHQSPYKGFSVEFSSHRRYHPGDEISLIDWGVWARTDKYYIKQFKAETNQQSYLVLDTSLSMNYQYRDNVSKLDYAISLAASLGYLMLHQQDSLGLILFDEKIHQLIPPSSKKQQLTKILQQLSRIQPTSPSKIADCLHHVAERVKHRGIILFFSDLIPTFNPSKKTNFLEEELRELQKALQHFRSKGQDVIIFQILDESEANFSFHDSMRFKDMESDLVVTSNPEVRGDYLNILHGYQKSIRKLCQKERMDFVTLHTGENFDKPLMSFLLKRKGKF